MALSPGTRLGAYEILTLIGSEGVGEVYRARDPRIGCDVAIEVLPTELCGDRDRVRRFEQEARAAASVNHSSVLAVYDIGTDNGVPHFVSELLDGETLRNRLKRRSTGNPSAVDGFPVRRAVDYAIQIARGVSAAHKKGIVHRNICCR